jgi:hypothetical protein
MRRAMLCRAALPASAFDPDSGVLVLRDLRFRVEGRICQDIRRSFGVAERHADGSGRQAIVEPGLSRDGPSPRRHAQSWIDDPAGISWETFFTTGESTDYGVSVDNDPRLAHAKAYCAPQEAAAMSSACCDR